MKLSIGKAWEEASAFLAREAKLVAPVALATFALPSILVGLAFPGGMAAGGGAGLMMLLALVASLWGQMTIVLLANHWTGSLGQALGKAAQSLAVLIVAFLLVFVPIILLFSLSLGLLLIGAGMNDPAAIAPAQIAKIPGVALTLLGLVLVFLFLAARLFLASAVAVMENVGVFALIKRSWRLTRGAFLRLLALVVLLLVIQFVLGLAVTTVIGSVAVLAAGELKPFNTSALIVALASGLLGAIIASIWAAMAGRVYAQLAGPQASVPNS